MELLGSSVGIRLAGVSSTVARQEIANALEQADEPDMRLAMGLLCYIDSTFSESDQHLQAAYLAFRRSGRQRRAAITATHLARLHQDGIGNSSVANGWMNRADRLLAHEGDCVERGWCLLPYTGCNILDADDLYRRSEDALDIARRFDDVDLECKALADFGLALMLHGRVSDGQALLDESMAMAHSGECSNMFVIAQIRCCLISACERTGDLARLEEWLVATAAAEPHVLGPDAPPSLILAHCQSQYGTLLCHAGRWPEAEAALRRVSQDAEPVHFHMRAIARAGLGLLRVEQGRLAEAGALLDGFEHRWEVQQTLARLHQARGDHDLAAAVARQAVRVLGSDHLRRPPLLAVLVDAELARGNTDAAREAADMMSADVVTAAPPANRALAYRAQAQLARHGGDLPQALALLEQALAALPGDQWPLLAADVHLEMARTTAVSDRAFAIAEARHALTTFSRVGAHRVREAQQLLHELGDPIATAPLLSGPAARLTAREREILRLVAEGLSNPQIAARLVISPKTAEHHVGSILRKLQLTSRSEAAVYAATMAS